MKIKQQIVTWGRTDGAYFNAWRDGHYGCIKGYLDEGWLIKHIKDFPENERLWVLFERFEEGQG